MNNLFIFCISLIEHRGIIAQKSVYATVFHSIQLTSYLLRFHKILIYHMEFKHQHQSHSFGSTTPIGLYIGQYPAGLIERLNHNSSIFFVRKARNKNLRFRIFQCLISDERDRTKEVIHNISYPSIQTLCLGNRLFLYRITHRTVVDVAYRILYSRQFIVLRIYLSCKLCTKVATVLTPPMFIEVVVSFIGIFTFQHAGCEIRNNSIPPLVSAIELTPSCSERNIQSCKRLVHILFVPVKVLRINLVIRRSFQGATA